MDHRGVKGHGIMNKIMNLQEIYQLMQLWSPALGIQANFVYIVY